MTNQIPVQALLSALQQTKSTHISQEQLLKGARQVSLFDTRKKLLIDMLENIFQGYPLLDTRKELQQHLSISHYIFEIVPRISFGRRGGHSSILREALLTGLLKNTTLVVPTYHGLSEFDENCLYRYGNQIVSASSSYDIKNDSKIIFDGEMALRDLLSFHQRQAPFPVHLFKAVIVGV